MNTEIQNQFASNEIAVRLRFLGFNEPCFGFFTGNNEEIQLSTKVLFTNEILGILHESKNGEGRFQITAPLWQQAITFINDLLCENGKSKRICFSDNIQAERDILKELELIEKQK